MRCSFLNWRYVFDKIYFVLNLSSSWFSNLKVHWIETRDLRSRSKIKFSFSNISSLRSQSERSVSNNHSAVHSHTFVVFYFLIFLNPKEYSWLVSRSIENVFNMFISLFKVSYDSKLCFHGTSISWKAFGSDAVGVLAYIKNKFRRRYNN